MSYPLYYTDILQYLRNLQLVWRNLEGPPETMWNRFVPKYCSFSNNFLKTNWEKAEKGKAVDICGRLSHHSDRSFKPIRNPIMVSYLIQNSSDKNIQKLLLHSKKNMHPYSIHAKNCFQRKIFGKCCNRHHRCHHPCLKTLKKWNIKIHNRKRFGLWGYAERFFGAVVKPEAVMMAIWRFLLFREHEEFFTVFFGHRNHKN